MIDRKELVELDGKTGILHYELLAVLYLLDAVKGNHFEQDPDNVDAMSEKECAYAFTSSYAPLYYCLNELKDLLEGAVEKSEHVRDLVEGMM